MCGITGFFSPSGFNLEVGKRLILSMTDRLYHRGPDDSGLWLNDINGIAFGHRRLSLLDLSNNGKQPMRSMSGRYIIVFNGEIYNHKEIRKKIDIQTDFKWRGNSDTETLLESIQIFGIQKTLDTVVGMFAFALWDSVQQKLFLARDRLGEKPLFYGWQKNSLLFGSELKSLTIHPDFQFQMDDSVLPEYFNHGYISAPRTIWKNIYKVLPGTIISFSSNGSEESIQYWKIDDIAELCQKRPIIYSETEAVKQLDLLLNDVISNQKIADVPIGAYLSGGIDSSTITALMQSQSSVPIKTFTVGFKEVNFNESSFAKKIATYLGTDHNEIIVDEKMAFGMLPNLSKIYDEPFSDSSSIPSFFLSRLARESVKVCLTGDGGDEVFGGYQRYSKFKKWHNHLKLFPRLFRKSVSNALYILPNFKNEKYQRNKFLLQEYLLFQSPENLYSNQLSHWLIGDKLISKDMSIIKKSSRINLNETLDFPMLFDLMNLLPNDILVKMDRAAMANSLETRIPLLDHRVIEWSWSIPQKFKTGLDYEKWILREVLYKYIPKQYFNRPKMGFGIPLGYWLRNRLKDWAEDLLDSDKIKSEGYLNPNSIQKKWIEHQKGINNWEHLLWDVLMFQSWILNQRR